MFKQILTETKDYIYNQFERICHTENMDNIETFLNTFKIDINRDDGYYVQIICLRNDLCLLQMFIKYGANVHLNNEGALRCCACSGLLHVVEYLLEHCKSDHTVLYGTTAYSNNPVIKQYIDDYILKII